MTPKTVGRYEIVGLLGRGAMGQVFRAFDPNIGRNLAIKLIPLDAGNPELQARFRREAQAAGLLSHPNIVTIYDAGADEQGLFIAMELIEGETLQQILGRGPLPIEQAVSLAEQVASALDHAHDQGIVHRDVKPANIMVSNGVAKVADFGVAKLNNAGMTTTGQVLGTPYYMAPELIKGDAADRRSDIFSFGVVVYQMLTGAQAFPGDNVSTVIYRVLSETPRSLPAANPAIPATLNAVVFKALAKNPAERYQSCGEFVAELKRGASGLPRQQESILGKEAAELITAGMARKAGAACQGSKTPAPAPSATNAAATPAANALQAASAKPARSGKGMYAAVAALVIAAFAGMAAWQLGKPAPQLTPPAAPAIAPAPPEPSRPVPAAERGPDVAADAASDPAAPPDLSLSRENGTGQSSNNSSNSSAASAGAASAATTGSYAKPVATPEMAARAKRPAPRKPASAKAAVAAPKPPAPMPPVAASQQNAAPSSAPPLTAPSMAAEGRNAPPPEAPPSTPPVSAGTGRVVVHTKPDGARVIVDGKQTGYKTPVNFALPSGAHLITLERNGVTETRRVLVEPNGITQIEIRIENRSGLLRRLPFRN